MRNKILAAAVTAAITLPMAVQAAGPTVYGKLIVGVEKVDGGTTAATDDQWDVASSVSRFGIKGDADLGGGLSAFYTYEFSVSADTATINAGNRLSFAGLKSSAGSVSIGRQWTAYYNTVGTHTDPTWQVGTETLSPFRASNMIKYAASFGPVSLEADVMANTDAVAGTDINSGVDRKALGASFKTGPVTVAAATDITDGDSVSVPEDTKLSGVAAAFDFGVVNVHVGYEQQSDVSANKTKVLTGYVGGSAGNVGYMAGYGITKDDDASVNGAGANKAKSPFVNVTYHFGKTTHTFVEYRQRDFNIGNDTSHIFIAFHQDF